MNFPATVNFETMTIEDIRSFISKVEEWGLKQDQVEFPLTHRFSKGVYAREIFIPKGCLIIGKIHKFANLNVLSKGDLSIVSIEGHQRVQAPYTVVSPPGVKRMAYAHEDSVWTTIHGTDETDLAKIEDEFIVKTYDELEESLKWLGQQ